jgi:high-affinity iron transporter
MLAAFLVVLREGFEATLLVAILLSYLVRIGHPEKRRWVWYGVAAAVALAVALGTALFATAASLGGNALDIFKGVAMWFAVAVLTYMIFWMRRQSRTLAHDIRKRVDSALGRTELPSSGAPPVGDLSASGVKGAGTFALAALAFVMVFREGVETALFMFGITQASTPLLVSIGGIVGLVGAIGLGYAVYAWGRRINMGMFFKVTGGLLLVVAAGLLAHGLVMFQSASIIPAFFWPLWDLSSIELLTHESFFGQFIIAFLGWDPKPGLLELGLWAGYLATVGYFFFRPSHPANAQKKAQNTEENTVKASN